MLVNSVFAPQAKTVDEPLSLEAHGIIIPICRILGEGLVLSFFAHKIFRRKKQ
mgnify:CR=1 FL=1